jgi:hypothetical protein
VLGRCRTETTYKLHEALLQLRHSNQPRTLWIDALCIDQENKDERSEQGKTMASIIGQASRVLCWLGEGDKQPDLAFKCMEELCWATKVLLWKRGSQRLQLPMCDLPDNFLDVLFDQEMSEPSVLEDSPFQPLVATNWNPSNVRYLSSLLTSARKPLRSQFQSLVLSL